MSAVHHTLQPHQQRVLVEEQELRERVRALADFVDDGVFRTLPFPEQDRLRRQLGYMTGYLVVLGERVASF